MKNQVLNKALTKLISRLESAESFVLAQAPEICKQMIKEEEIKLKFGIASLSALSTVFLSVVITAALSAYDKPSNDAIGLAFVAVPAFMAFVPTAAGLINQIQSIIVLKNCPKLFLLREFKRLLK